MSTNTYVKECAIGRGVFAARDLAAGELILAFGGDVLNADEVLAKGAAEGNTLQIGPDRYIDCEAPGLYTNHSCTPNAGVKRDTLLIALRDIPADEQICFDYSTTMSEDGWTLQCQCGTAECRGLILDFHLLPDALKRRYLRLGVVQDFIVAEHQLRLTPSVRTMRRLLPGRYELA